MIKPHRVAPLLLLLALPALALADARQALDRFAEGLESLSGRFSQITVGDDGRVSDYTEGRLFFEQPDRFRWSYTEPFPQEMVADGERLWHYDESLDQVTVRPQPAPEESPLLVLTRPDLLDRFYRLEPSDSDEVLRFEPVGGDGEFESASLHFSDGLPSALELIDRFGQLTRLELFELERNAELPADIFDFVVPEGADLLDGF